MWGDKTMKKAYCLYRVSTKKQVDVQKDDIPMQKLACHEFAEQNGWIITKEFYEKGVSGFKVSANDRDAIQDLKTAAQKHEFEVLLVYMFDRLGRIDSETPFVVEWFISQGIEVWSTQEGQQKLETQGDKLMNYIRYWQANGESVKTSMRLKTRMAQLTAEGTYHGGVVPFGYRAVNKGRKNKKGQPVKDLELDPGEAEIVKTIFNKTLNEGYGSYRLAEYINSLGIKTHNGSCFQCNTINRILKNRLYCGYYAAGDTISPKLEHLAVIDDNVFDSVQHILKQRSGINDEKQHIARTTKGKTLLSGNIYCAHCGGALNASNKIESHKRKDGTVCSHQTIRYICYHKARKLNECDGQSVYMANKIDNVILEIVEHYLSAIKQTPRDKALELRYSREIDEKKKLKAELARQKFKLENRLNELAAEIGKCLSGESVFTIDVLSLSIDSTKKELKSTADKLTECDTVLSEKTKIFNKLDYYYQQFVTWADEFKNASNERKKMIICGLIDYVKVGRGYKIEIKFNISYRQFFSENCRYIPKCNNLAANVTEETTAI